MIFISRYTPKPTPLFSTNNYKHLDKPGLTHLQDNTMPSEAANPPLRPEAATLPRRVSFGPIPLPRRPSTTRTTSKTSELHHAFMPAEKAKSMSDLDKEEEVRMVKSHREKVKKGLVGVMDWVRAKIQGGEEKKV